jgi:ribonuclease HI
MKAMIGKGNDSFATIPPIKRPGDDTLPPTNQIADMFLDLFGSSSDFPQDNATLEPFIKSHILNRSPNDLNSMFTPPELDKALKKLKSNATGIDEIHNAMLTNLSQTNKKNILHLFNAIYINDFVPEPWKKAIIIPLLKPGKPADSTISYRPISLTSCLGKLFERLLTNRLDWYVESRNLLGPEQAGFRKSRSTIDHLVKIDLDIKRGFKEKESTVAVFLDINKAYDTVWTKGLLYKLAKIGLTGNCLGWLQNFLQNRSICIRLGSYTSQSREIKNGVPQGAVLSPLLFNLMLIDFPTPPPPIQLLLYADDVNIYTRVKQPIDAETVLQPYIDKVAKWGRKWKFKFSASKSTTVSFTRSYKPGDDPLLFLNGHRIPNASKFKFLGVILDAKLLWKDHIAYIVNKCIRLKNAFSIIAKATHAPSIKSLCILFKSLVRSRMDYGLIVYGSACKTNLLKIDIAARSILRIILGSKPSTPTELIYAETGTEPTTARRDWLSTRFLILLNQNPTNLTYKPVKILHDSIETWPPRNNPTLKMVSTAIKNQGINLFRHPAGVTDQINKQPAPWASPPAHFKWFPIPKIVAASNHQDVAELFNSLLSNIQNPSTHAYTDGSVTKNPPSSSCAVYIPDLNISDSWRLSPGSSVFSAELHGIRKALSLIYASDSPASEIHLFTDSSAAIKAIAASDKSTNRCIPEIRNLLSCLKSSGTITTLYWIPSHSGIAGNEAADKLASAETSHPTGKVIKNELSPGEQISIMKASWEQSVLQKLKTCNKPSVQVKTKLGITPWHHTNDRPTTTCLHRLRSGHTHLNSFAHRIDIGADPSCRQGCAAIESIHHVLIDCPAHHTHRQKINRFFDTANLQLNTQTLLGLNPAIDTKTQFKILNLLSAFLSKSNLKHTA